MQRHRQRAGRGRVELWLSAEYTSGYWSSPAATDLAPDDLHRSDAWRSSAGVRWLFAGDRAGASWLLVGEGAAMRVAAMSAFVERP